MNANQMIVIIYFIFITICLACPPPLDEHQQRKCDDRVSIDKIEECDDKPTVFLFGPTRNGKSFYANLLLNYANDMENNEEEAFESSESELSVTSSIQCVCGNKYRVCDSPGIPDICGKAHEYLDGIVRFMQTNAPNLILFVLDSGYNLMNSVSEYYYKALIKCFSAFSEKNTYILFNKVTGKDWKFKKNLKIYNGKLKKAADWLGINYLTNNITHLYDKYELTNRAKIIIDGFINDTPNLYTINYKTFTNIIETAIKGLDECSANNIIDIYENKIQIKKSDKKWYKEQIEFMKQRQRYITSTMIGAGVLAATAGIAGGGIAATAVAFCPPCAAIAFAKISTYIGSVALNSTLYELGKRKNELSSEIRNLKSELKILKENAKIRMRKCEEEIKEIELMTQQLCITTPSFKDKLRKLSKLTQTMKDEL